ncbi:MAG: hypothetical protein R3190_07600 [Thermoanaerobaculia bacterium]|nr:hypothetical protein [Thermoanaerobaculia bacterium]
MADPTPPRDPMDVWRQRLTQAERDWNRYFNDLMGTDTFAQTMGLWMNGVLELQRTLGAALERYFTTLNLPTGSDVKEIAERLTRIEERLRRIEAATSAPVERPRRPTPPRTRKPPAAAAAAAPAATPAAEPKTAAKSAPKRKTAPKKAARKKAARRTPETGA